MPTTRTTTAALPRLFVAALPSAPALAQILEWRQRWLAGTDGCRIRPLHAADLHLTLRFLGPTPAARHVEIASAMSSVARDHRPCACVLDRYEAWPARQPRVAVLAGDGAPPLLALQAALERCATALGHAPEARGFRPHLTIARPAADAVLPPPPPVGAVHVEIDRLHLMAGGADATGRRYRVLASLPLVAGP